MIIIETNMVLVEEIVIANGIAETISRNPEVRSVRVADLTIEGILPQLIYTAKEN